MTAAWGSTFFVDKLAIFNFTFFVGPGLASFSRTMVVMAMDIHDIELIPDTDMVILQKVIYSFASECQVIKGY